MSQMQKCVVIYYDGFESKVAVLESEYPDSALPHTWGLPDDYDIQAVIEFEQHVVDCVVYIDEHGNRLSVDNSAK